MKMRCFDQFVYKANCKFHAWNMMLIILFVKLFAGCTNLSDYVGFYVTKGYFENNRYTTMTVYDTVVYLNENNIDTNFTDTICKIDQTRHMVSEIKFLKSIGFVFLAIKPYKDSIHLIRVTDIPDPDTITFYKLSRKKNHKDWFSESLLDIDLKHFSSDTDTLAVIDGKKIHHLNIGHVKPILWSFFIKDTIIIEDHSFRVLINKNEFTELFESLNEFKKDYFICINSDKSVPDLTRIQLRKELIQYCDNKRIVESRNKDNEIVYIK